MNPKHNELSIANSTSETDFTTMSEVDHDTPLISCTNEPSSMISSSSVKRDFSTFEAVNFGSGMFNQPVAFRKLTLED